MASLAANYTSEPTKTLDWHSLKCDRLSVPELEVGDIVVFYGNVFRCLERRDHRDCTSFALECVHVDVDGMPVAYRENWTAQGNEKSLVCRLLNFPQYK